MLAGERLVREPVAAVDRGPACAPPATARRRGTSGRGRPRPASPGRRAVGTWRSWRNGNRAEREELLELRAQPRPAPRRRGRDRRRDHLLAQALELGDRGLALGREPLLEHRVARDRDPHEPDDHLAVVSRLAARGTLLREPDLGEQRAHGRHRAEAVEPLAHALEERDVRRPVASRRSGTPTIACTSGLRYACSSGKLRTQPPSVAMTPSTLTGRTSPLTAAEARSARPIVSGGVERDEYASSKCRESSAVDVVADVGREDDELDRPLRRAPSRAPRRCRSAPRSSPAACSRGARRGAATSARGRKTSSGWSPSTNCSRSSSRSSAAIVPQSAPAEVP